MFEFGMLSLIIFLPLLGSILVLVSWSRHTLCRLITVCTTMADFTLVIYLTLFGTAGHSDAGGKWLLTENRPWIQHFGIQYSLGMDGISLALILLTTFLSVLCVLTSWKQINNRVAAFHFFLLLMESGILGVFLATDLFLFYLFWELQLIPMFFIIGIWGHEKRIQATVKFVIFTMAGSLLMLVALIVLFIINARQTGQYSFALVHLIHTQLTSPVEHILYAAFLLAFLIKIPVLPLHTWLPDAHTEAPTAGSVILAGLLLKTGAYALFRFAFPLFPLAAQSSVPLLILAGLSGMFYAAWIAFAQTDMKRLVAYSSISHMGLMVVGIAVWNQITMNGVVLQMVNHGLSTAALFILVGMLDERFKSRDLALFGGLWSKMPVFAGFFLFFALASMGLPGLNNFVGEMLILIGIFKKSVVVAVAGIAGILMTVIYILHLIQSLLFGEIRSSSIRDLVVPDVTPREALILLPLAVAILFIGLHPMSMVSLFQVSVKNVLMHCLSLFLTTA
jgi:NADH-quinone oxidoreductase subunit M